MGTVEALQILITANTLQLKKEMNNTTSELKKLEKKVGKSTNNISSLFKKMIPVGVIALGLKKANDLIKTSEQAYKDQIQNETRLLAVMTKRSEVTKQDIQDIFDLTDAQQRLGIVGDEVQLAGAEELATYIDKADSIKKLIPQMNNMIAQQYGYNATQEEAINIATMMGKVLEGQTGALSRYGYYFDENQEKILKFGTEEEKVATLTSIIHESIGDVNEALGNTAIGKQIQLANAWGDVKEQLGYVAVQVKQVLVPVFQTLVTWLGTAVSFLRQFLQVLGFTAKKQNGVTKSIIGGANAEKDYGDAVEDSTKKQNKQLASFDEMNVLKEENDSGSSGGSGGDDGIGGFNDVDFNVGIDGDLEVSKRIEDLVNKIKTKFDEAKEIVLDIWNSEPIQSFVNFAQTSFEFLESFVIQMGETIWKNLSMTWNNVKNNLETTLSNMTTLWTNFFNDISAGIETWGQPIIDGMSNLFNSVWTDAIDPTIQLIVQRWADFSGILVKMWDKHGKPLINNIGEFVTTTIALFQKIWDDIIDPIVTPMLENLSWLWDKHIKYMVEDLVDFIGKLVNGALEIYNKFIAPIINDLITKLAPAWSFLSNLVTGVIGSIIAVIVDLVSAIFKYLGGIIDFIIGIFTGNWKKAWNGITSILSACVKTWDSIVKFPINLIIDALNSFIAGINKIKIPDWVPGVGGKGLNIPKIPKLAQGGVVDKPIFAQLGENGKEVVMPLERNTGWIDQLAEKINSSGNGDTPMQLVVKIGEETVFDKFIDYSNKKNFETNGEVFNV